MNKRIALIVDGILEREGAAYTDHPDDSGGPTKYGITRPTLSKFLGYPASNKDVESLTEQMARAVYLDLYINQPGFWRVNQLSAAIFEELVDSGVNCGPPRAIEWLQRSLNALNRRGRDYPDIQVDLVCGPITASALGIFLAKRGDDGETVLLRALNCLQGAYYIGLAERRPKDEAFLFGWLLNRIG